MCYVRQGDNYVPLSLNFVLMEDGRVRLMVIRPKIGMMRPRQARGRGEMKFILGLTWGVCIGLSIGNWANNPANAVKAYQWGKWTRERILHLPPLSHPKSPTNGRTD